MRKLGIIVILLVNIFLISFIYKSCSKDGEYVRIRYEVNIFEQKLRANVHKTQNELQDLINEVEGDVPGRWRVSKSETRLIESIKKYKDYRSFNIYKKCYYAINYKGEIELYNK